LVDNYAILVSISEEIEFLLNFYATRGLLVTTTF